MNDNKDNFSNFSSTDDAITDIFFQQASGNTASDTSTDAPADTPSDISGNASSNADNYSRADISGNSNDDVSDIIPSDTPGDASEKREYTIRKANPHKPVQGINNQPKKKIKFKPYIVVILVILVILLAAGIIRYATGIDKKASDNSDNSADNGNKTSLLYSVININSPVKDYIGHDKLVNQINKSGSLVKADININNLGFANISKDDINGLSLSYESLNSQKSCQKSNNLSFGYRGINALSMTSYSDKDTFMFKVPLLSASFYSFDISKFNDTFISLMTDDTFMEDIDYSVFILFNNIINHMTTDYSEYLDNYANCDIWGLMDKNYPEVSAELKNSITSSPAENSYNGNEGTTYTISGEQLKNHLESLYKICSENNDIRNFFITIFNSDLFNLPNQTVNSDNQSDDNDSDDYNFDDSDNSDDYNFNNLNFDELNIEDTFVSIWKNPDGMIECMEFGTMYNDTPYTVTINRNVDTDGTLTTSSESVVFNIPSVPSQPYSIVETLDSATGDYEFSMVIPHKNDNVQFDLMGTFTNVVKGSSFDFTLDNLIVSKGYTNLLDIDGVISFGASAKKPEKPSGSVLDVTQMHIKEINETLEEIYNFFKISRIIHE